MVAMIKKVKIFQIVFNDPSKAFYCSGDKVAGKIVVEVTDITRVSAMRVLGIGSAKVNYSKDKHRCREEIDYLKYEEVVHLDGHPTDTDGSVILRPGNKYEYTFGFELPQQGQLVSSYRGKFGSVQYYVKALMESASQPVFECKKSFEVEEPLDVNTPDLLSPVGGMKEKKVTCMFIPDGQVSLNAKIDRRGFCEGEDIFIDAKFENTCSRIVVPKAAIVAKQTYQANGNHKVIREKLSSLRGNHIISGMCDAWIGKAIRVPKIKPSIQCGIIRVEYVLMIYMLIPGSKKLVLELPLVIGTVPYSGLSSRSNSMSSQESSSWVSLRLPSSCPPSYCDVTRDCRLDQPLTPLLDDYDGEDSPLFMHSPQFTFPPLPPYSEKDLDLYQLTFFFSTSRRKTTLTPVLSRFQVEEEYNGNPRMLPVC
ncbi:Thioredoxin-interacting protein [Bagarius yarrelli]|uniref:Thioredoxin-interacting protein n=1 Tax=Bagarius yarrelli TaxID=175774 RepID=A0A556VTX8_BAGYA|nr:Thioredoxin-interacting protein [Bagarius yarrelli]